MKRIKRNGDSYKTAYTLSQRLSMLRSKVRIQLATERYSKDNTRSINQHLLDVIAEEEVSKD